MTTDEAIEYAELEVACPSRDDIANEVMSALAAEVLRLREQIRLLREAAGEQDVRLAGVEAERDELEAECERRAIETGLLRRERDTLEKETDRLRMCFDEPMETMADMRAELEALRQAVSRVEMRELEAKR